MRRFQSAALAAVAVIGFASTAFAADMPVKAQPPAASIYNWSGIYLGVQGGYEWATVHDTTPAFVQTDSKVRDGVIGMHGGAQWQFGRTPWGSWLVGVEGSLNVPTEKNSFGNFTPCANPTFLCGLTNINDLATVGGRLGLAADRLLFTVSGGWATAVFKRTDFVPATGLVGSGGGASQARHNGAYAGAGLEYLLNKGTLADLVGGVDYKHVWLNAGTDIDANGVGHTLSSQVDMVTARLTLKFNPWSAGMQ
jgi:outer membrane immunogenic protein